MSIERKAHILVLAALCVLTARTLHADTVYLKNGNSYEGTVLSRTDKQVVVKVGEKQVTVPAEDVLFVKYARAEAPDKRPEASPGTHVTGDALAGLESKPFSADDATRPESIVFMLMRTLAASPGGTNRGLDQQIEQWRIAAHDHKRGLGARWISPKEFAAKRAVYADLLKEAQDLAKEAERRHSRRGRGRRRPLKKTREWAAAAAKLREAAMEWPGSLLRDFLVGLAALQAEQYDVAAARLRDCVEAAPRVAGFRQAYGKSLLGLKEHTAALSEFTEMLRLLPGSRDAIDLVQETMQETPGGLTKEPAYVRARELLDEYEKPTRRRYTRSGEAWLMPGRAWYVSERSLLPTPPYDRLVFRQGVAVPAGKHTLIVDAKVVRDAEQITVRLGPRTVVGARKRRLSFRGAGAGREALAFVQLDGVEFTPVKFDEQARPRPGEPVTFHGIGIYEEMGRGVRQVNTKIKSLRDDGSFELASGPLAGEAAGAILASGGRLVSFTAGKTDVKAKDGGEGLGMPPAQIAELISRAKRGSSHYGAYGRVDRKQSAEPLIARGSAFVVYAIAAEKLE